MPIQKLQKESDILDPVFRARVLAEISGNENQRRKNEAFKRYECFKDLTEIYVRELLLKQFDPITVAEMQYAVTDISFTRKIVDKLAKVYSNGVKRTMPKVKDTKSVEVAADYLKMNMRMKKTNRFFKLFKNTSMYIKPVPVADKFDIKLSPMPPFLYDVIEDPQNEECAMVYILSSFQPNRAMLYATNAATALRSVGQSVHEVMPQRGDGVDQIIADAATDKAPDEFIWWSPNYHFTTNKKGDITTAPDATTGQVSIQNPIGMLPFVNYAEDQDDSFWAQGGSDLVESGIKINTLLTNINHVAICQGYGQLYMTGKNLPKAIKVGPNHCVKMEYEEGEPEPKVGFLSANPPIADLMKLVEMYVSLLLSTNNLSTSGFSASLSGGQAFASGIALLIDKSESIEDVEDQAAVFRDNEPRVWEIIANWQSIYKARQLLVEELQELTLPLEYDDLTVAFPSSQVILTEKDKLEIIKERKDLGLNTMIELLMRDDPSLDEKAAEEKLLKITEEKALAMQEAMNNAAAMGDEDPSQEGKKVDDQGNGQQGKSKQDNLDN